MPYPAGGATDVAARLLAPRLQEELKQNVVVENKPGASGNLGMVTLLQSPPDGHTLAMSLTGMLSINPVTFSKAGFTAANFVPVARVSLAPLVLVVPANSGWKTVGDLVAAGKGRRQRAPARAACPTGPPALAACRTWRPNCSTPTPTATTPMCPTRAVHRWCKR